MHDFQILYTDVQIFYLGSHDVLKIQVCLKPWSYLVSLYILSFSCILRLQHKVLGKRLNKLRLTFLFNV